MKKRRTKKTRRWPWVLFWVFVGVPLIVIALLAALNWIVMPLLTEHGKETPVPDLRGMSRVEATLAITAAGLTPGDVRVVQDTSAAPDHVIAHVPRPGRMVKPGRLVHLDVSRGSNLTLVPDVAGLSLPEATDRLEEAGLVVAEIESLRTPNLPVGRVIAVKPAAGTEVRLGGTVVLAVSAPVGKFPMPNLLGMSSETASGIIASQGLILGSIRDAPSDEPAGLVMVQYPEEGMSVQDGDSVHLIVTVLLPLPDSL